MPANSPRLRWLAPAWYVFLCLFGTWFFNRHSIELGGELVYGDRGDSRFHMVTLEHWWRVVQGLDPLLSPNFFYPTPGAIAYSDLLGLYALFYVPFRAFGFDSYGAFQLTIGAVSVVGFWGMLLLLRRSLDIPPMVAGLYSLLFAYSGLKTMTFAETHIWAVAYTPFLAFFAIEYFRRVSMPPSRRLPWALAFVVVFAALALTSFYVVWFTAVFGLLVAVCTLVTYCVLRGPGQTFGLILRWVASNAAHIAIIMGAAAVAMWPFLAIYLPNSGQVDRNILGAIPQLMYPWKLPFLGVTQLLLAIATGMAALVWLRRSRPLDTRWTVALCLAPAIFLVLLFLLPLGKFTLWTALYLVVPGGKFIRAPVRFYTFLTLPLLVVGSVGLTALIAKVREKKGDAGDFLGAVVLGLLLLVTAEQYKPGIPLVFPKSPDHAWLHRVQKPPAECRSFALKPVADPKTWERHLDAMIVAQRFNLPTLNGYSGTEPIGWRLHDPGSANYAAAIRDWAESNGLTGVCLLDDDAGTWSSLNAAAR